MAHKFLIAGALGALLLGGFLTWMQIGKETSNTPGSGQAACTMEAKLCPDGSAVGRMGPSCEFAECPSAHATSTVGLGGALEKLAIRIMPQKVVEDSRCALDVTCIWAGTVRVAVILDAEGEQKTLTLRLGEPVVFAGRVIELVSVSPAPYSKILIKDEAYLFDFRVMLENSVE